MTTAVTASPSETLRQMHLKIDQDGETREIILLMTEAEADDWVRRFADLVVEAKADDPQTTACDAWTTSRAEARATPGVRWERTRLQRPPRAIRTVARSRAPRRSPRRGGAKTAQDPGDPDGDPDPVEDRIRALVDAWPPFSPGQCALLGRLLGGS